MSIYGLHQTKCAGTSFITSFRRSLSEDEYFIASSLKENILAGRSSFWNEIQHEKLRIIFGHYFHENMIGTANHGNPWSFNIFTGFRNPKDRAYSNYLHNKRGNIKNIDDYVDGIGQTSCDEIIRAFPSLYDNNLSKIENVLRILTCFDYAYLSNLFSDHIRYIFELLEVDYKIYNDNIADHSISLSNEEINLIDSKVDDSDDFKVYQFIYELCGKPSFGLNLANKMGIYDNREFWWNNLNKYNQESKMKDLNKYLLDMYLEESRRFYNIEDSKMILDLVHNRAINYQTIISNINTHKQEG